MDSGRFKVTLSSWSLFKLSLTRSMSYFHWFNSSLSNAVVVILGSCFFLLPYELEEDMTCWCIPCRELVCDCLCDLSLSVSDLMMRTSSSPILGDSNGPSIFLFASMSKFFIRLILESAWTCSCTFCMFRGGIRTIRPWEDDNEGCSG